MFSLLVCLGNQRFSASCHEQGKLCVTGVDINQNVSSKHRAVAKEALQGGCNGRLNLPTKGVVIGCGH